MLFVLCVIFCLFSFFRLVDASFEFYFLSFHCFV